MNDDPRLPRITAVFTIAGMDFDPAVCTQRLGVEPTRVWRREDTQHLRNHPSLDRVTWAFRERRYLDQIEPVVVAVLDTIWPRRAVVAELRDELEATTALTCNVLIHEDRPLYELSPVTLRRIAQLEATFYFDIF